MRDRRAMHRAKDYQSCRQCEKPLRQPRFHSGRITESPKPAHHQAFIQGRISKIPARRGHVFCDGPPRIRAKPCWVRHETHPTWIQISRMRAVFGAGAHLSFQRGSLRRYRFLHEGVASFDGTCLGQSYRPTRVSRSTLTLHGPPRNAISRLSSPCCPFFHRPLTSADLIPSDSIPHRPHRRHHLSRQQDRLWHVRGKRPPSRRPPEDSLILTLCPCASRSSNSPTLNLPRDSS